MKHKMKRTRLGISLLVIAFCIVAFFSVLKEQRVETLAICGGIIGTVASFYNYSEGKWPSSDRSSFPWVQPGGVVPRENTEE